eukprot:CAMPEP_0202869094 /NCGR_PEP_ID=MMETSP1391-20130828/11829_1 /ASSEMBLY_ACC=CAM_ASM_000867 /TAXON_ID=1034604 /ORGANISM="Chlamydomonas leiostraca, Strain SAG 11-49" /LENGTH=188 /DNA_ID=CAMNT_0049549351 /DNA_START=208 /DNA_END=774 /DNA_ORIENTATION=-
MAWPCSPNKTRTRPSIQPGHKLAHARPVGLVLCGVALKQRRLLQHHLLLQDPPQQQRQRQARLAARQRGQAQAGQQQAAVHGVAQVRVHAGGHQRVLGARARHGRQVAAQRQQRVRDEHQTRGQAHRAHQVHQALQLEGAEHQQRHHHHLRNEPALAPRPDLCLELIDQLLTCKVVLVDLDVVADGPT